MTARRGTVAGGVMMAEPTFEMNAPAAAKPRLGGGRKVK
jgi:hypothetical protein